MVKPNVKLLYAGRDALQDEAHGDLPEFDQCLTRIDPGLTLVKLLLAGGDALQEEADEDLPEGHHRAPPHLPRQGSQPQEQVSGQTANLTGGQTKMWFDWWSNQNAVNSQEGSASLWTAVKPFSRVWPVVKFLFVLPGPSWPGQRLAV